MSNDLTDRAAEIVNGALQSNHLPTSSDDALALAFTEKYSGQYLYVPAWSSWVRWDGCRWARDETLVVFDLVRRLCREKSALLRGNDASRLASAGTIAAVERLARSDRRHVRRADDFDADPWVLNTPGGVINLQTEEMRPHRLSDLHTKVAGAIPGGGCPRWLTFLREITHGDVDLIAYLQRWAGYSLTGIIRENAFLFAWGPGGNGKSVLLDTLAAVLGDYATTAMADVFTVGRNEQHPTHVASLRGARMVVVPETEEGRPWAESRIKSMTGGDRISARVMRGDPFEFSPQFKLWIAGNHRPLLRNPDPAMRRRLHLIPMTFVPDKPDRGLPEALKAELPGILAWAIKGCVAWQREGLGEPAIVRDAGAEYFAEQDSIASWFDEQCVRDANATASARALFNDWSDYAKARGEEAGTEKRFSERLQRHAAKKRTNKGVVFPGIKLRSSESGA
ncbi:phage/plasmid primase, P4 family [Limobrevibacterium gyesilva]|uniref:Phage/plasmid primase, P4 family n=1 Tax=Limobrevibacterium gyesilva TaxID=2991712 RepID=A0AA41YQC0_9PROT|nr:phage/plasmid primase, P4 family [Limobrevibacterium gyesilva]MCW3474683.1 phage/plasmid primase, P4 family [Limobrevibacterium gyesilva]